MATVLFDNGIHQCIVFDDLLSKDDIQANQFLIIHDGEGLLFDPGGSKVFDPLYKQVSDFISPRRIRTIVLSHQDPDTGAAVNWWMLFSASRVYVPHLWVRFVPHFCRNDFEEHHYASIPEEGMRLDFNGGEVLLVPAHFLHSPGNIQLYDPHAKVLFTGDLGTSIIPGVSGFSEVTDFDNHARYMEGFHRRYMTSGKACRLWADMAKTLDISAIVPQHGHRYFKGRSMVDRFIGWVRNLECGVDLVREQHYRIPAARPAGRSV
jgi:flavorubredoxin